MGQNFKDVYNLRATRHLVFHWGMSQNSSIKNKPAIKNEVMG
jgi:hypothetical protein